MSEILQLANLCTSITIKPSYKAGDPKTVSVDAHVVIKSKDGCMQYADIHSEATTTEAAIKRALKAALSYEEGCE